MIWIAVGVLLSLAGGTVAGAADALAYGLVSNQSWSNADALLQARSFSLSHWVDWTDKYLPVTTSRPVLQGKAEATYVNPSCAFDPGFTPGVLVLSLKDGRVVGVKAEACPNAAR